MRVTTATVGSVGLFSSGDNEAAEYWQMHVERLAECDAFRGRVDRLRSLAQGTHRHGYARTTGRLDTKPYAELLDDRSAGWARDRPRRWSDSKTWGYPEHGNDHAARYLTSLSAVSGECLGATTAATAVHHLVAGSGYTLPLPHDVGNWPYPTGAAASVIDAHFTGASWGIEPSSQRRSWQRWKSTNFRFVRDI